MTKHTVSEVANSEDLDKVIALRYEVLRKPWDQPYESSKDDLEDRSLNVFIESDGKKVIACGRLQKNSDEIAQVRYMALTPEERGKGLGAAILSYLEKRSGEWSIKRIQLQARDN